MLNLLGDERGLQVWIFFKIAASLEKQMMRVNWILGTSAKQTAIHTWAQQLNAILFLWQNNEFIPVRRFHLLITKGVRGRPLLEQNMKQNPSPWGHTPFLGRLGLEPIELPQLKFYLYRVNVTETAQLLWSFIASKQCRIRLLHNCQTNMNHLITPRGKLSHCCCKDSKCKIL